MKQPRVERPLAPELARFIEAAVVPALVDRWLREADVAREAGERRPDASLRDPDREDDVRRLS